MLSTWTCDVTCHVGKHNCSGIMQSALTLLATPPDPFAGALQIQVDSNMLSRYDLASDGPMFESRSGELSNLRWDLPLAEMPSYYRRPNRKLYTAEWGLLANFTKGLAGGGPGTR
jgi:hypothetical protein